MDNKIECSGVYLPNKFVLGRIPNGLTKTWSWSKHLTGRDIEYANLWASGKSLNDVCPEHLEERWQNAEALLRSHFKAFHTSKMKLTDVCFYDIIPQKHLQHYFDCKNEITEWVFENIAKPKNYYFLKETHENLRHLATHTINLNSFALYCISSVDLKAKHLYEQFAEAPPNIDYNLFGTVTGRLTTKKGSFPILNLKGELKNHVTPHNDVFLELDFNASEIRTMLALQGHEQPMEDIHEWNIKNVFKQDISREEAKTKIFAWLYNGNSQVIKSDFYDRESLLEKYFSGEAVQTPFGRTINAPIRKALNYLLQSTSSDNTIDRFNVISKFLRGTRSHVAAVVHDSVIIDLHRDDRRLIPQVKQLFEETKLGKFKVNVSIGKNLGHMKEFSWTT
tara:strand:+ start:159 stop:1337 length:1179 start_codon:yes stop_codon:yes gene_type:complete